MKSGPGILYGVGVGPGDPELITLKAVRVLKAARVVCFFRKRGSKGHALSIARPFLPVSAVEIPFEYPVTTEVRFTDEDYVRPISEFYAVAANSIAHYLGEGQDVALLCEGDPFFYGSFLHMYERLKGNFPSVVIPGVTGMSGCWTSAGAPIALGDDVLTVLPGTLAADDLTAKLRSTDAAAIMKVGCNLPKIREALRLSGRLEEAIYVERGTMEGERVVPLWQVEALAAPYFSIVLVPGCRGRRIL